MQERRLYAAQRFQGRLRLRLAMTLKRLLWLAAVHGAELVRRLFDVSVSIVALILAAPLMLLIAALVRLDGGPVFFRQRRVGLNGREFGMLKFRSMCVDAEARLKEVLALNEKSHGVTFKVRNDPRITRIGRFIRKASIDELPQFFNVLCGDMAIVGPRPSLPREVLHYSAADRRRLRAKPGITCLWQVGERSGGLWEIGDRNCIDFDEQVALDVRYIESRSLSRDVWILIKTIPAIVLGKGM